VVAVAAAHDDAAGVEGGGGGGGEGEAQGADEEEDGSGGVHVGGWVVGWLGGWWLVVCVCEVVKMVGDEKRSGMKKGYLYVSLSPRVSVPQGGVSLRLT
jgi:hypothetical protein